MVKLITHAPKETPKEFRYDYPLPEGWQHIGVSVQNNLMYGARFRTARNENCYLVIKSEYDMLNAVARTRFAIFAHGVHTAKNALTPWFDTADACFVYWAMTNQEDVDV